MTQQREELPNGGVRIILPSGGWVEFASPKTIKRGKHRKLIYSRVSNWENPGLVGLELMEAIASQLITAWKIPEFPDAPIPRDEPGMLGELDGEDYDAIVLEAKNARTVIFPDQSVDGADQPGSPTEPASA